MASWAFRVAQEPLHAPAPEREDLSGKRVAVLDANAIIDMGSGVMEPDVVHFTTAGVLKEIRDPSSRATLAAMQLRTREPAAEALRAVRAFAQKTGDLHQLSEVDVSLLALTYTLEAEQHSVEHLRTAPAPVQAHRREHTSNRLPGWDNDAGADWSAVDAVPGACVES
jgi:RNA-binding protein NOB1